MKINTNAYGLGFAWRQLANRRRPIPAACRSVRAFCLVAALIGAGCAGNEQEVQADPNAHGGAAAGGAGGGTLPVAGSDAGPASPAPGPSAHPPASGPGFTVPMESHVCDQPLPFKPPGCPCNPGQTMPCWTGPLDKRNMGQCKDGVQTCSTGVEIATWGQCEGAILDCGMPPPDPPPPTKKCGCVPGAVVGCDEDCEALVICKPFSTKVCQPDGTFGPCREALLPTADSNLLGCINLFHGCFPENPEGLFSGDCSKTFTCGRPPEGTSLGLF